MTSTLHTPLRINRPRELVSHFQVNSTIRPISAKVVLLAPTYSILTHSSALAHPQAAGRFIC
jgi:hypothetical protein